MAILRVESARLEDIVRAAVEALEAGELVVMPTDTVYGLAARADDRAAVERIYAAKRRPADRPLPLLVPDIAAMSRYGRQVPEEALALARAFWPGPLTIAVPRAETIPAWVTAGEETVGLRQPDNELALAILDAAKFPVAVTSANISGDATPLRAQECAEALAEPVAVVIEAGPLGGRPSTVVVVRAGGQVDVVREGPISVGAIRRVVERRIQGEGAR